MNTCESCKHWDTSFWPNQPMAYDNGEMVQVPGKWGDCKRIQHLSGDSHGTPPSLSEMTEDPAYLADGSKYFANLTSRSDFGCTLWEAK